MRSVSQSKATEMYMKSRVMQSKNQVRPGPNYLADARRLADRGLAIVPLSRCYHEDMTESDPGSPVFSDWHEQSTSDIVVNEERWASDNQVIGEDLHGFVVEQGRGSLQFLRSGQMPKGEGRPILSDPARAVGIDTEKSELIVVRAKNSEADIRLHAMAGVQPTTDEDDLGTEVSSLDRTFSAITPNGIEYHFRGDPWPVIDSLIGEGMLAEGIEVISQGGLIVGAGHNIFVVDENADVMPVPEWLIAARANVEAAKATTRAKATAYLEAAEPATGPFAMSWIIHVVARMMQYGLSDFETGMLMADWGTRCQPAQDVASILYCADYVIDEKVILPDNAAIDPRELAISDYSAYSEAMASRPSPITFTGDDDDEADAQREYIIKGVLARGDIAAIIGKPGVGKSIIAPYIGRCIAAGGDLFGTRTRQGGVLYVAAEDPQGMKARSKALKKQYGAAPGFKVVSGIADLGDQKGRDFKTLMGAVRERHPVLIIVDTVHQSFPGLEENTSDGMGKVIAAGRALAAHGAAVIFIHHDTKSGGDSARGHGSFDGALDMRLYLTKDEKSGIVSGKLGKNRNGSLDAWKPAFRLGIETLGIDKDGDPITAAYAKEADAPANPVDEFDRLTGVSQEQREAILSAIGDGYCRVRMSSEKWPGYAPKLATVLGHDLGTYRRDDGKRITEDGRSPKQKAERANLDAILRQMVEENILKVEIQKSKGDDHQIYVVC